MLLEFLFFLTLLIGYLSKINAKFYWEYLRRTDHRIRPYKTPKDFELHYHCFNDMDKYFKSSTLSGLYLPHPFIENLFTKDKLVNKIKLLSFTMLIFYLVIAVIIFVHME